jgi:hypothetical protein
MSRSHLRRVQEIEITQREHSSDEWSDSRGGEQTLSRTRWRPHVGSRGHVATWAYMNHHVVDLLLLFPAKVSINNRTCSTTRSFIILSLADPTNLGFGRKKYTEGGRSKKKLQPSVLLGWYLPIQGSMRRSVDLVFRLCRSWGNPGATCRLDRAFPRTCRAHHQHWRAVKVSNSTSTIQETLRLPTTSTS